MGIKIDWDVLTSWIIDETFSDEGPYRLYVGRLTGEVVAVFDDDEHAESSGCYTRAENSQNAERVSSCPKDFVEITLPDHVQVHEWFVEFLDSMNRADEYEPMRSIGAWLGQHLDERNDWFAYQSDCKERHALQCLRNAGADVG